MEKVEKTWGWEHWFINTAKYCGKLLFVRNGVWSSKGAYHYHVIKDETFFVIEGELRIDYVTYSGEFKTIILKKYDSFQVEPFIKHRFTAITEEGCKFVEAATTHSETDSYRVNWNEDKWVPV